MKRVESFPFDVNFFDGDRMSAVSAEYGVKGEITAVKLLCAIFREGYFAQWRESQRRKLLRQLPGVSGLLLDRIVECLVRWEFFDKGLFDSARVLTSFDIQRVYFSAIRWRVPDIEGLSYLLPEIRQRLQAIRDSLSQRKTKKSNQKKIKETEKEEDNNVFFSQEMRDKAAGVLRLYNMAISHYRKSFPDGWPCRLAMARKLTAERIGPLCHIADNYSENEIKSAFWNATKSAYCNGRTKERSRPADVMWLVDPRVFVRLLEGNV